MYKNTKPNQRQEINNPQLSMYAGIILRLSEHEYSGLRAGATYGRGYYYCMEINRGGKKKKQGIYWKEEQEKIY